MFYLDIPTIEGIKRELVYNVKDFPYTSFLYDVSTVRKNKKNYLNLSATFDIETTTIEQKKTKKENTKFRLMVLCIIGKLAYVIKLFLGAHGMSF